MTASRTILSGLLLLAIFCASCANPGSQLPIYDSVPEFQATDSHGKLFTRKDMAGKVWVVDFIYTSCPAECPLMSSKMKHVAADLKGENDVRILSVSVDPAHDTPPVLQNFANRYGGGNEQWRFITATPETVHLLAFETFHVGDVIGKLEHSTKFALVDKLGRIRGYYSSLNGDDLKTMLRDVTNLRKVTS